MPKLIIKRKPSKLKNQRSRKSIVPHSPFQMLIEDAKLAKSLSNRGLSTAMAKHGVKTNQSTIWVWLHSENGYPDPRYFGEKHIKSLALVLGLQEHQIRTALDQSRTIYTGTQNPRPAAAHDALETLRQLLASKKTTWIRTATILNTVIALQSVAKSPAPPTQ